MEKLSKQHIQGVAKAFDTYSQTEHIYIYIYSLKKSDILGSIVCYSKFSHKFIDAKALCKREQEILLRFPPF